jgi:hypothetical protein
MRFEHKFWGHEPISLFPCDSVYGLGCTVYGLRCTVYGLGFAVYGSRFSSGDIILFPLLLFAIHGSRFKVHGSRFRVLGFGFRVRYEPAFPVTRSVFSLRIMP